MLWIIGMISRYYHFKVVREICTPHLHNDSQRFCGWNMWLCWCLPIPISSLSLCLYLVTEPVRYRSRTSQTGSWKAKTKVGTLPFFCVVRLLSLISSADRLMLPKLKVCLNSHSSPLVSSRLADFLLLLLSTFQLSSIASVSIQSGLLNLQSNNRPRPPRPPLVPVPKAAWSIFLLSQRSTPHSIKCCSL